MAKRVFILFVVSFIFFKGYSQQPEEPLSRRARQNPIEKIYLHSDRTDYIAGQTIWLKGYLYADFMADNNSTTLFVELLNTSSIIIARRALPVFGGYARGQIELPDTLPGGAYMLRAYTATMLNQDPGFLFKKNFFIFSKNKEASLSAAIKPKAVRMEFFPEGGNFVTGLSNTIAYKATNENGLPAAISGVVKKESGEKVAEFSSYHDGMGFFDLTAEEKDTYYAVLNDDPSGQKYYLPSQTSKGIVLRVISIGQTKQFEILQRNDDSVFKAAYMIGQMQQHLVFKKVFQEGKDEMTGFIQTADLVSGILHITVFNKNGMPLAERLTFVDNKEYILQGDVLFDTLNFSEKGRNHFTLSLKDTVSGSFSLSITDPSFDLLPVRQENIFSGLLLTSDLKGYVHDPAYYFSATNDSIQNALDLVMMTNGWRRFKWNDLVKDPLPAKKYSDPGYIKLAGKINLQDSKKAFAGKELLLFIAGNDSSRNMQMLHTDTEGGFSIDSIVFFGRARILFSDIKGKKNRYIDVKLNADSLNKAYDLPKISIEEHSEPGILSSDWAKKMLDEYNAVMKAEGLMLEGVTVKVRKKTELELVEEKYVSPLFSGQANSTLNLTKEDLTPYRNILDYLQFRVPGLQISTDPLNSGSIMVEYRQQANLSSMGNIPMAIFLNEVPSDADAISSIPAHEIVLVKVFSSFVGASGNAPGGVLAVYTKKDSDLSSLPPAVDVITYGGYSIIKEFYSPDYRVDTTGNKIDNRITLFWNPSVLVADINPKIPFTFYNNDRNRQFKIVLEGMTIDGKMLMIEKTIGSKKAF